MLGLILTNNNVSERAAKIKPPANNVAITAAIGAKTKPPANNIIITAALSVKTKPSTDKIIANISMLSKAESIIV